MKQLFDMLDGLQNLAGYHASKLEAVLEGLDEVDICGMTYTDDISAIITHYCTKGLHVYDSADPDRDAVYQENWKRYQTGLMLKEQGVTALPPLDDVSGQGIIDYLKALNPELNYARGALPSVFFIPLVELISWYRPTIKLAIGSDFGLVIEDVYDTLNKYNASKLITPECDDYVLYIDGACIPMHITEKELDVPFNVAGIGDITWNTIMTDYSFIPAYFSEVAGKNLSPALQALWKPVKDLAVKRVQDYVGTLPTAKCKVVDSNGNTHYRKNTMAHAITMK